MTRRSVPPQALAIAGLLLTFCLAATVSFAQTRAAASQPSSEASLYERLGGIYPIAVGSMTSSTDCS